MALDNRTLSCYNLMCKEKKGESIITKTYCDICGREIAPNYIRSNRYWMKIEPYTSIVGDSKQVNE